MPQMYPMNWIILFTFFLTIFMIFMMQLYFNFKFSYINNKSLIKLSYMKNWNKFW